MSFLFAVDRALNSYIMITIMIAIQQRNELKRRAGVDHPSTPDRQGGSSLGYGSERPYTGVKGPHRSEGIPRR